jgi:hypothetical protein
MTLKTCQSAATLQANLRTSRLALQTDHNKMTDAELNSPKGLKNSSVSSPERG